MKTVYLLAIIVTISVALTCPRRVVAENNSIGNETKKAAGEIKEAGKETGKTVKNAVSQKQLKETGRSIKKAGKDTVEVIKDTGREIKKDVKKLTEGKDDKK